MAWGLVVAGERRSAMPTGVAESMLLRAGQVAALFGIVALSASCGSGGLEERMGAFLAREFENALRKAHRDVPGYEVSVETTGADAHMVRTVEKSDVFDRVTTKPGLLAASVPEAEGIVLPPDAKVGMFEKWHDGSRVGALAATQWDVERTDAFYRARLEELGWELSGEAREAGARKYDYAQGGRSVRLAIEQGKRGTLVTFTLHEHEGQ